MSNFWFLHHNQFLDVIITYENWTSGKRRNKSYQVLASSKSSNDAVCRFNDLDQPLFHLSTFSCCALKIKQMKHFQPELTSWRSGWRHRYWGGRFEVRLPSRLNRTVSPTARHRCDVFTELCSPGAKPRWAPPLVTRFGVISRVMKICFVIWLSN